MKNLDYKGIKSTRVVLVLLVVSLASVFLSLGLIEAGHWVTVIMSLGITHGVTEVGAKASEAWRDRQS